MSAPVVIARDRSLLVGPGQLVVTGWIDIDLVVLGCRAPMAVGDVGDKWRELLQRRDHAAWPPPVGFWRPAGDNPRRRFVITDGRHEYVAALMHGRERLFVAWVVPPDGQEIRDGPD